MLRLITKSSWYKLLRAKACPSVRGKPRHSQGEGRKNMSHWVVNQEKSNVTHTELPKRLKSVRALLKVWSQLSQKHEEETLYTWNILFHSFRRCYFLSLISPAGRTCFQFSCGMACSHDIISGYCTCEWMGWNKNPKLSVTLLLSSTSRNDKSAPYIHAGGSCEAVFTGIHC